MAATSRQGSTCCGAMGHIHRLLSKPNLTVNTAMEDHRVTFCAANLVVGRLVEDEIFVKNAGRRCNRVLYAAQVIEALSRSSSE